MPIAFESASGIIETAFAADKDVAMANLSKLISERQAQFPFDPSNQFNVAVRLEVQFVRKAGVQAIPVRVERDNPEALPVAITEEDSLGVYRWRSGDLCAHLQGRYSDFKQNEKFYELLRPLEENRSYCDTRFLDPGNPKSAKQKRYNPNIVKEFDPHYTPAAS